MTTLRDHSLHRFFLMPAILVALAFLFSSCALFHKSSAPKNEHQLMRNAIEAFNNRDYKKAIQDFQTIKDQYPFSPYTLLAELKIADSHYNREEYAEAIFEYEDFIKLHPRNEAVPYALYQIGMSYFKQMRSIDRDQDTTRKAVAEFQRLIRTYPNSPFRVRAENRLSICLQSLALHEVYVGKHYFKKKKYKAAKARFEGVVKNFPDLGQYNEALDYIKKCDDKLRVIEEKRAQAEEREKANEEKLKQKEQQPKNKT